MPTRRTLVAALALVVPFGAIPDAPQRPVSTSATPFVVELGRPDKVWSREELAVGLLRRCGEAGEVGAVTSCHIGDVREVRMWVSTRRSFRVGDAS